MNMRRLALFSLLLLATVSAFGHAGEVHKYMGTIAAMHDDGSFLLKTTDGESIHVAVSAKTAFVQADGRPGSRADLAAGTRLVATISTDGKTATTIRFAAKKK